MQFEYDINNAKALLDVPHNIQVVVNSAFRMTVDDAQKRAQELAGKGRPNNLIYRSGGFRNSIKKSPYKQWSPGGIGQQTVYTTTPWARVHEEGATITAKRAPFLVFRLMNPGDTTEATGPFRRARSVRIPARPTFGPAAEFAVRNYPENVEEALRIVLAGGVPNVGGSR